MKNLKYIGYLIMLSLALSSCKEEEQQATEQIKAVKTIVISATKDLNTRVISGVIKTAKESILSFRVPGRITKINVERGDTVTQNQILVELDQNDFILALGTAKAKLQTAEVELTAAEQENKRQQDLLKRDYVSEAAAEKAAASYQSAVGRLAVAKADMQTAEDNLTRTVLRAPFAGKIASREIESFRQVKTGEAIFLLQELDNFKVEILAPETIIRQLNIGDQSIVIFPTLTDVRLNAIISQIGAQSESGNAFAVTLKLTETNPDIRVGMAAEVIVNVNNSNNDTAFLIPTSALNLRFFDASTNTNNINQSHVLVVDEESTTLKLKKIIVEDVQGNNLRVIDGLNVGDRVVVAGVAFLNEGQKVKLWQPQYSIPATLGK